MEDLDLYLGVVVAVYAIVEICGTGFILYRFAKPFMENKKEAFCIGIAYFVTMLIMYFVPIQINIFVAYSLGILSAFTAMCSIDRRNYKQKIFIAVTFFSLNWLSKYSSLRVIIHTAL